MKKTEKSPHTMLMVLCEHGKTCIHLVSLSVKVMLAIRNFKGKALSSVAHVLYEKNILKT